MTPYSIENLRELVPAETYTMIHQVLVLSQWFFWSSITCFVIGLILIRVKNESYKKWLLIGGIFPPLMLILFFTKKKTKTLSQSEIELREIQAEMLALEAKARYYKDQLQEQSQKLAAQTTLSEAQLTLPKKTVSTDKFSFEATKKEPAE